MPPGHLNALFVEDLNVLDQKDYMKAIEEAHNQERSSSGIIRDGE